MHSSNRSYIPQVDHLRAVAALWIVFYHGEQLFEAILRTGKNFVGEWHYTLNPLISVIREGHSAVALFMVLSGFIFTYGAYGRTISYKPFITNRILRIYPLFICLVFLSIATTPGAFDLSKLISTVLPLANMQLLETGPLVSMAWAVAVEFQFYLIFPFLLQFLNRGTWKFVVAVIGTALLFRLIAVGLGANARDLSYWHLIGRIDQFALGMVSAVLLRNITVKTRTLRWMFIASVVLVIAMLFGFHRLGGWPVNEPWKIIWPTIEGLIYGFLIVTYVSSGPLVPKRLGWMLAKLGETSFSIYLLHFAIIHIVLRQGWVWQATGNHSADAVITTATVTVPLTILAAAVTYRCIEVPFLSMRRKYILPAPESSTPLQ